ncbi:AAA family ATPase CDC6 [Pneumocystis jirovecii RU7]|uniref:Cell division control protein n=1 Tax=Pneumocystis jirovecii (strain RU7) TaxID=1408657 RepID=A0A0W4ZUZ2_PNEJ7|nr:AAA family ATPase CDC6 [Pneumocystis jirovecii RU7]KTW32147.1 hypothetical protein T551_00829 [Pneumocystis jirovecii RU7]
MSLDLKKRMRINSSENVFMNIQAKRVKNNQGYTFNQNDLDSEDELTVLSPKTPTRYRKINSQTGLIYMQKIKCPLTPCHLKTAYRTPVSKRTSTPITQTPYSKGKALFSRGTIPVPLTGRSSERTFITKFIECHMKQKQGGSLYVCGPPGTGKTVIITDIVEQQFTGKNITSASINCIAQDPKNIYSEVYRKLFKKVEISEKKAFEQLKKLIFKNNMYLLLLDEIDSLVVKDQEILYQLFEWSIIKDSQLIIIGISNTLDLTDRFLPRLKAKNAVPEVFVFKPYTPQEISDIVKSRLRLLSENTSEDFIPLIHPTALELCSRKISSSSGDIRKAFDLIRKAIELLEAELYIDSKKPLSEVSPNKLMSPDTNKYPAFSEENLENLPKITTEHILRVSSLIHGGSIITRLKNFTLQQKAILCALSVCEKENPNHILIGKVSPLFDTYMYLCRRDKLLHPLSSVEFSDVVGTLEASMTVNITNTIISSKANDIMNKKIKLIVPKMDILTAIGDIDLLRRFFQ